ncbi:hypothetical protein [Rubellimicrobium rubrum]|uniref:hypothetical protein n=1 Tax=Rubellimicrobium rubrum TaxID=2585369 RepID=UPI00159BAAB7|nr:hypothetical protein [Rubellimicrobium rubrum]
MLQDDPHVDPVREAQDGVKHFDTMAESMQPMSPIAASDAVSSVEADLRSHLSVAALQALCAVVGILDRARAANSESAPADWARSDDVLRLEWVGGRAVDPTGLAEDRPNDHGSAEDHAAPVVQGCGSRTATLRSSRRTNAGTADGMAARSESSLGLQQALTTDSVERLGYRGRALFGGRHGTADDHMEIEIGTGWLCGRSLPI